MYHQIITYLFNFIIYQQRIITLLMAIILGKSVARRLYDEPIDKPYRKLVVDEMPIIDTPEKLDYPELLTGYELDNGRPLKPVQRRKKQLGKCTEIINMFKMPCAF